MIVQGSVVEFSPAKREIVDVTRESIGNFCF